MKVSEGCRHCYAERIALNYGLTPQPWAAQHAEENVQFHETRLALPRGWQPRTRVFVCSMSDFFLEVVPDEWRQRVLRVIEDTPQHTYLILTKRASRLCLHEPYPPNVWLGVSVEQRRHLDRIQSLRHVQAAVRWVSFEPLLEHLGPLDLTGIHWVVVGGESGPKHRPMDHAWARSIRDQCFEDGVPFYFKQSAGVRSETGTLLEEADGRRAEWRQYPGIRRRTFPGS